MNVAIKIQIICLLGFMLNSACSDEPNQAPESLAKTYCGSCHGFPDPSLLDKTGWKMNVLPAMSTKLGLKQFFDEYYADVRKDSGQQIVSVENWNKIVEYYLKNAPDSLPPQNRPPIEQITSRFEARAPSMDAKIFPSATYVRIDPGNQWIYAANALDSSLLIFNSELRQIARISLHGVIVDIDFGNEMNKGGSRGGVITNIGIINPNDFKTGTADSFQIDQDGRLIYLKRVIQNLPRPVQISGTDLNNDGMKDFLVCGFGNQKGQMSWMQAKEDGSFQENIILSQPGAIKAYIEDVNKDGLKDIWAMFAQGRESIYLFTNKGKGTFEMKTILDFPPIYGSTYFEFADFNKDGHQDILYTCGDNADLTSKSLKNYHGIYIYINNGKNEFENKFFFPINGCYKAVARDFDLDGDLDISAVSFFADYKNQPKEAFVYLENGGNMNYKPFTIDKYAAGKWITMDAADADGDGDEDIVIGSLAPESDLSSSGEAQSKVLFLLLENKTKKN